MVLLEVQLEALLVERHQQVQQPDERQEALLDEVQLEALPPLLKHIPSVSIVLAIIPQRVQRSIGEIRLHFNILRVQVRLSHHLVHRGHIQVLLSTERRQVKQ